MRILCIILALFLSLIEFVVIWFVIIAINNLVTSIKKIT